MYFDLLTLKEGIDEDDEISCTPALAPSRLAQNVPDYQLALDIEILQEHATSVAVSEANSVTKSDCSDVENNHMDVNSGHESEKLEEELKESVESSALVDPSLSTSFLNVLYDVELNESKPVEIKVGSQIFH